MFILWQKCFSQQKNVTFWQKTLQLPKTKFKETNSFSQEASIHWIPLDNETDMLIKRKAQKAKF